jgi:hypothetical protein
MSLFFHASEIFENLFGRHGRSAFATDGRCHAHPQLVFSQTVARQDRPRPVHHVDPAGRNVVIPGVNLLTTATSDLSDFYEASLVNRHIRDDSGIARAIEHAAVTNDEVILRVGLRIGGDARRPARRVDVNNQRE